MSLYVLIIFFFFLNLIYILIRHAPMGRNIVNPPNQPILSGIGND